MPPLSEKRENVSQNLSEMIFFCLFCSDVFPKMWSEFIDCTKSFAASCISSAELSHFNRAVGTSINSVHKMCTNEDYKKGKF